jgi:ADP-ribose pyrophosphatase YjhB (NUDIX family)
MVKRLSPTMFNKIYSIVPRLCVEAIILRDGGKQVVLSKREIEPAMGKWHIPGGTVLMNETLSTAVKRVAREETGLVVRPVYIIGAIEYRDTYAGTGQQPIGVAIECVAYEGEIIGSEQAQDVRWFAELPSMCDMIGEQYMFLVRLMKGDTG